MACSKNPYFFFYFMFPQCTISPIYKDIGGRVHGIAFIPMLYLQKKIIGGFSVEDQIKDNTSAFESAAIR